MSQIAPVMHREPVELDTRYISRKLRAEVLLKCNGRCAKCGVRIVAGEFDVDHIIRWADGGRTALGNLEALCRPCHREKTHGTDTPGAAKTKRMTSACEVRDPDEIEPGQIRSRGFPTHLTKGVDGKVRPRKHRPTKASQNGSEPREGGSINRRATPNPSGTS